MSFLHYKLCYKIWLHKLIYLLLLLFSIQTVHAHQMRPAIVTISFDQNAQVTVQIQTNVEALLSGIGAEHENTDDAPQAEVYRELRELPAEQLSERFVTFAHEFSKGLSLKLSNRSVNWSLLSISVPEIGDTRLSRKSKIEYTAKVPPGASSAVWSLDQKYGDAVVSFMSQGQPDKATFWLVKGDKSPEYRLHEKVIPRYWSEVVKDYIGLGAIHILPKGLDHILFVLGLFLLSQKFKPLLWQVTAFTLAHTLTLALSMYGVISISPLIIEPLIALSIAYVGFENMFTRDLKPWRIVIVFLFGLLHGLGFAGVLTELGLPESQFVTALISFNIGVEMGQLSVILLAFIAVFWLRKNQHLYRKLIVIPGSLGIALMGLYWTWSRII